jgi:arylsulfatase
MPGQKQGKGVIPVFTTVLDMAPTFLDLAKGSYPSTYHGHSIQPYQGASILSLLNGEQEQVHQDNYAVGWELFGRCALRKGHWKLTKIEAPFGKNRFELFNLDEDPTESNDLSVEQPEKYQELLAEWDRYVEHNGVILVNSQ